MSEKIEKLIEKLKKVKDQEPLKEIIAELEFENNALQWKVSKKKYGEIGYPYFAGYPIQVILLSRQVWFRLEPSNIIIRLSPNEKENSIIINEMSKEEAKEK